MSYILASLLAIYSLPLIGIVGSIISSKLFTEVVPIVGIVAAISATYVGTFRDFFGNLIVPLLTAYALPAGTLPRSIRPVTIAIFTFSLIVFILATVSHGIILQRKDLIVRAEDIEVFEAFKDLTLTYAKEALAYIGLTIGISASPGQGAVPEPRPAAAGPTGSS